MTEVWVLETSLKRQILCQQCRKAESVISVSDGSKHKTHMCTTGHIISKYKVLKGHLHKL